METSKYSKAETKILCEEIKKKYSIIDYVRSKGIPMIHRGNDAYMIKCPFHGDNNPSLSIEKHGDIDLFYCFGCKKRGSIIDFFSEYEHVSIGEAIKILGDGIDFDFDITSLLDELKEKKNELSIFDMNVAISIHCFEYLSIVKSKFSKDIINKEFDKMNSLYKIIDNLIKNNEIEKINSFYQEICFGNFFVNRFKIIGEKNEDQCNI